MIVPANWEGWRLWSRQPVIVDCKGLPYGGRPYHEWLRRAVDLYVSAAGIGCFDQWKLLTLADIERIGGKYNADYAVFYSKDPKLSAARRARVARDLQHVSVGRSSHARDFRSVRAPANGKVIYRRRASGSNRAKFTGSPGPAAFPARPRRCPGV